MNNEIVEVPKASQIATFFEAERLNQMHKLATYFHQAGCFGADVKNPQQALVKIQAGFEMGMAPMEAMNSLYIVNGKLTIYGMAMSKRLRLKGWRIAYDESKPGETTVTISKSDEMYSYTATLEELKKLRSKAADFAAKDKLKWHALSRLIRFYVPEVLEAGVAYLKEEIEDMPPAPGISVMDMPSDAVIIDADTILKQIEEAKELEELQQIAESIDKLTGEELKNVREAIIKKREQLKHIEKQAEDVIVGVDMANKEPDVSIETTINVDTGKILEASAVRNTPARTHKKLNDYWSFEKITQMVTAFKTREEVIGFKEELIRIYNDGEITETMMKHGIAAIQTKLNQVNAKNAQAQI